MRTFKQYLNENRRNIMVEKRLPAGAKAIALENKAFDKVKKLLDAKPFQTPAGADAGFPDFGFSIELGNGRVIDAHIEYKADTTAQMGSMRDWIFDGTKFMSNDKDSNQKRELLDIMNGSPKTIKNGKRLLNDLQQYVDPKIDRLFKGSVKHIKDMDLRRKLMINFKEKTDNFQLAKIQDTSLGKRILQHYVKKFKNNIRPKADANILLMMMEDKIWLVDTKGKISPKEMTEVANRFGLKSFDKLSNLIAKLEVRIQPRGLNSGKPVSIDVMASYRLKGKPNGGGKII